MTGLNGITSNHDNAKMASREGVGRSLSFTGPGTRTSPQGGLVLGERLRHSPSGGSRTSPTVSPLNHSVRGAPKIPKVPRPSRALHMFTSVKRGLRECVEATTQDIDKLRTCSDLASASSTGQGKIHDYEKQIKAAERYQKRLEFQLAKVEELEEHYNLQEQLREGVKNMAKAYVSLPGNHKKESLSNVKFGYKECTQTMCAIEAQLETMLGTFHCQMKGMSGFARLAPGDVFEVSVRYGHQKWKTKGRVGVNHQTWDHEYIVFKSLVGELFAIKAVESRGLGRTVVLGQKNCETKDLFSSHPQLMTVNINANGSLKLSLVITWSPLEAQEENICFYEPPPKSQGVGRRKFHTSPSEDLRKAALIADHNGLSNQHQSSLPSRSSNASSRLSVHNESTTEKLQTKPALRPNSVAIMNSGSLNDSLDNQQQRPKLFDMRMTSEPISETSMSRPTTLEEAIHTVSTILEDFRGQYSELQKLEEQIQDLDRLVRKSMGAGSARSSDVSISIENALGAFDFLESEDYKDYSQNSRQTSIEQLEANSTLSPESTAKTNDSGIESLGRLQEDQMLEENERCSSPELPSTGNEEVDQAMLWHLCYCERLLENLGNFGPLKCREIYSLEKLSKQADIIEDLISIAKAGSVVTNLHAVLIKLTEKKDVRHFWTRCVDQTVLYTSTDKFINQLERTFKDAIVERYDTAPNKVFRVMVARVLDIATFDETDSHSNVPVTMHALVGFFEDKERDDMLGYVLQLAGELWVSPRLRSGDTDLIIKTTLSFRESLPPAECLRIAAMLLITEDKEIRDTISYYLRGLGADAKLREKAVVAFVEALEDRSADVRCAACMALKQLNAVECMDQLVYVCQTDTSHMVRVKSKETLMTFGEDGKRAFQDSELSSHGFQGVQIHF